MNRLSCFVLLSSLITLPGCGGGPTGGQPVFEATGTVTLFGSPLADATVAFAPTSGQPTAIGKTDKDGKFVLTTYDFGDGAAEGKFSVVVTKAMPAAEAAKADEAHGTDFVDTAAKGHGAGGAGSAAASMVPDQYTSSKTTPLSAEVKSSGENVFTFEIK